jgi:cell division protein FtsB
MKLEERMVKGFRKEPRKVKPKRPIVLFLYITFWVAMLAMFAGLVVYQMGRYNELVEQQIRIEAELEAERAIAQDLYLQQILFDSDAYIEQLARDRLGLVRPYEIVFRNIAE